ncbi:zona pellucida sperm-binding protein 3-like [Alligator sinensis]|uniref:Zona pellucida sperm-binding protein 3 n=1 Tax=Alligator sinensis TaxID=38654 RepID=A0A1U7SBP0_ALLSI|nr:zona pellucida sperm-binding protein 3-like [Alligator sinensis]
MVVSVSPDLLGQGRPVRPMELGLGGCSPTGLGAVVRFEVELHECGSTLEVTSDSLIYKTSLVYHPAPAPVMRSRPLVVPIECRYPRQGHVGGKAIQPTWLPFAGSALAHARMGFGLRLMDDDWRGERPSKLLRLGDILHLQAELHAKNHGPLRVLVDACEATAHGDGTSGPRHTLVAHNGCLVDGRLDGASSAFLAPRPRPDVLRFTLDAFRFAGDTGDSIYISCRLKVMEAVRAPDPWNKACSFNKASRSWIPVEGHPEICRCCEAGTCLPSRGDADELGSRHWPPAPDDQRSAVVLPTELPGSQVRAIIGPLLLQTGDGDESSRHLAEGPGEVEEILAEGLLLVTPSRAVMSTSALFLQAGEGSADLPEEASTEPAPMTVSTAYTLHGQSNAEEMSGDGTEEATKTTTDKSPEFAFQAEVFSDLHHLLERDGEPTDDILENRMEAAPMAAQGDEETQEYMLGPALLGTALFLVLTTLGILILVRRFGGSVLCL